MRRIIYGITLLVLVSGSANAALLSRAGGHAYYDTTLNISWIADANLAATNTFGVADITAYGAMGWSTANKWIGAMNGANYLGKSDWRLPTVTDTGTPGCDFAWTGTDCGFNVDPSTGEMAHLFYSTLGNTAYYDTSGVITGNTCNLGPNYCNTGPFSNLQTSLYWSGTTTTVPYSGYAWLFRFDLGYQGPDTNYYYYAWAVRPGDIGGAVVPVPGAVWLLGSALGVMGVLRRRSLTAA